MKEGLLEMKRCAIILLMVAVGIGSTYAADDVRSSRGSLDKSAGVTWSKKALQGFSMRVYLSNQLAMGIQAFGPNLPPPGDCGDGIGLEYPAGSSSCIEHLYGAGPLVGGKINGSPRVSEAYNSEDARTEFYPERKDTARDRIWLTSTNNRTYDVNFNSGPRVLLTPANRRKCDDDGDGKVDEDELDGADNDGDWILLTDDVGTDGLADAVEVSCNGIPYSPTNLDPAQDNYEPSKTDACRPDPNTGNFPRKNDKSKYTEKNGIPDHGEPHVDEDYGAVSESDMYMTATDTGTSSIISGHIPMGLKIFQKSYAWDGDFADGILPMDYEIINVGRNVITEVYVGFIADLDVGPVNVPGYFNNNYACYMPELRTAYIHNAIDRGSTPVGLTVLGTPKPLNELKYIFQWYPSGSLGTNDSVIYTWLNGTQFGGQLIKPCQAPETPSDTRIFFSFGPFDIIRPGDTLRISMALVGGEGVDAGPRNLKENAEKALRLYSNGYQTSTILPSPKLVAEPGFKKITLRWFPGTGARSPIGPAGAWDDSNKIAGALPDTHWRRIDPPCGDEGTGGSCSTGHVCVDGKLPGGRIFEGFRLYRSEDPNTTPDAKSFTLLRQYDMTGDEFEYNTGIESTFVDTNLARGKRYHYAVTSFGIPNVTLVETPTPAGIQIDTLYTPGSESPVNENRTTVDLTFSVSSTVGQVLAVPNPYRVDQDYTYENGGWEGRSRVWTENNRLIKFIHLPIRCTIRVFTLVGDLVVTLEHNDPVSGELSWNILSESNRALASGTYLFTVESDLGTQLGKFVLIR